MKKILSVKFAFIMLFTSCKSPLIYTHSQVMNRINTKSQLIQKYGLPTSKSREGDIEQWIYNFGTVSRSRTYVNPTNVNTTASYNQYNNTVQLNSRTNPTYGFTSTSSYNRYAKFLLRGNSVIKWETKGINEEVINKKVRNRNQIISYLTGFAIGLPLFLLLLDEDQY